MPRAAAFVADWAKIPACALGLGLQRARPFRSGSQIPLPLLPASIQNALLGTFLALATGGGAASRPGGPSTPQKSPPLALRGGLKGEKAMAEEPNKGLGTSAGENQPMGKA